MSNNPWDDLRDGLNQARELERAAQYYAAQMGRMLRGKLHHCNHSDLEALKRELSNYNLRTGKWRDGR